MSFEPLNELAIKAHDRHLSECEEFTNEMFSQIVARRAIIVPFSRFALRPTPFSINLRRNSIVHYKACIIADCDWISVDFLSNLSQVLLWYI